MLYLMVTAGGKGQLDQLRAIADGEAKVHELEVAGSGGSEAAIKAVV